MFLAIDTATAYDQMMFIVADAMVLGCIVTTAIFLLAMARPGR